MDGYGGYACATKVGLGTIKVDVLLSVVAIIDAKFP